MTPVGYRLPTDTSTISCDWQCHRSRNPPSSEPGTDYPAPYGSNVYAVASGRVTYIKTTNSGAMGRVVEYALDDGRHTRSIHLSQVLVSVGARVSKGQVIAKSGASGFGKDWGYGAHVHQTLWPGAAWAATPVDFALYVGEEANVGAGQRTVGPNGVNGRSEPRTGATLKQTLAAGTIGDFDAYMHGEDVNGQNVWYRGKHSGDWFWSGGFTQGANGAGLTNVTPVTVEKNQRVAGANGVNARTTASTSGTIVATYPAGFVGTYNGWVHGESVDGNDVWFHGASNDWSWSGGFEGGAKVDGLTDLNEAAKPTEPDAGGDATVDSTRTVGVNPVNGRSGPATKYAIVQTLDGGTVGTFDGWTKGEAVNGIDVWFHGAFSGNWFWAGGFTTQDTTALEEMEFDEDANAVNELDPAAPWKGYTADSPLATWVGSPNYNYRAGKEKVGLALHWMAGTLAGTDAEFQKPGTVVDGRGTNQSTQYGVNASEVHQYVREQDYSHGAGNADANATLIQIEHEGGYLSGGAIVPVSEAVLTMGAKLGVEIAIRKGWATKDNGFQFEWKTNVFPHNHFVATACPGTLDHEFWIAKANELLAAELGTGTPPITDPVPPTTTVPESLITEWNEFKAEMDAFVDGVES